MGFRDYVLSGTDRELKRLEYQSMLFERETMATLKLAGIKRGMHCLELGCGAGDVSFMISKFVGSKGSVTGLDANEDLVRVCMKRAKQRHITTAKFVVGDVYDPKLRKNNFDFVFSRFLFQHLREPKKAIREMVKLAKVGGIIAAEELDHGAWISYPHMESLERLKRVYLELLKMSGADELVARKLYKFFYEAGLDPNAAAYSICLPMNKKPFNMIGILMAEVLKPRILKAGLMTIDEYDEMIAGFKKHMKDPSMIMLYALTLRVWGKKHR